MSQGLGFQLQTGLILAIFSLAFAAVYFANKRHSVAGWSAIAYACALGGYVLDNTRDMIDNIAVIWATTTFFWLFCITILQAVCARARVSFPAKYIISLLAIAYPLFWISTNYTADISMRSILVNAVSALILIPGIMVLCRGRRSLADNVFIGALVGTAATFLLRVALVYAILGFTLTEENYSGSIYASIFHLTNAICALTLAMGVSFVIAYDKIQQHQNQSTLDPLTGLLNRRGLAAIFDVRDGHPDSDGKSRALILFDIDHFKQINDTYGHVAGDKVLIRIASTAAEICQGMGKVARVGGEEFVVFTEPMDTQATQFVARQLCAALGQIRHPELEGDGRVTASFGHVMLNREETLANATARADKGLYKAKNNGRNQIVFDRAA